MNIKSIIEKNDTIAGKVFDYIIQITIIVSLVSFSIDTLPHLTEKSKSILKIIEIITVTIFSLEYILRILVADNKLKFILSVEGIIDILAIAPFYLQTGIDLRSIRAFRLMRLLRGFKFLRYSNTLIRFKKVFQKIKNEILFYLLATIVLIYLASAGIYYFEAPHQPQNSLDLSSTVYGGL